MLIGFWEISGSAASALAESSAAAAKASIFGMSVWVGELLNVERRHWEPHAGKLALRLLR